MGKGLSAYEMAFSQIVLFDNLKLLEFLILLHDNTHAHLYIQCRLAHNVSTVWSIM